MKNTLLAICLFTIVPTVTMSQQSYQILASISGKYVKILQAALIEASKNKIDIEKYRIQIAENHASYFVVFDDPARKDSQRGSSDNMLSFEVEIKKNDFQVVRANFVR